MPIVDIHNSTEFFEEFDACTFHCPEVREDPFIQQICQHEIAIIGETIDGISEARGEACSVAHVKAKAASIRDNETLLNFWKICLRILESEEPFLIRGGLDGILVLARRGVPAKFAAYLFCSPVRGGAAISKVDSDSGM